MTASETIVRVEGLKKAFGSLTVLHDFNLEVKAGERLVLIGPSGSGKTTVLRTLMTVDWPSAGTLTVAGKSLTFPARQKRPPARQLREYRQNLGMVFQQFNLFPHMTALDNIIEAPMAVFGMKRAAAIELASDLLARVGLADKAAAFPAQLSGGQQQRIAIARALAMRPKVMLFDEVTSALDPERVAEVLDVIRELSSGYGMTMLIVTHEMGFAREIADRILFMEAGRVIEEGPPEQIFDAPQNARTQSFLSKVMHK